MAPPPPPPAAPRPRPWRAAAAGLALALIGAWALRPALDGGWLWDDDHEVTNNWILKAPDGLSRLWLHPPGPDYFPLKGTVQLLEWRLFGPAPLGYHAVTLALHLLGALLLWRVLRRLGAGWAWLGGLLFALHPLAVESVAWAAELKNTLALPLLLGAVLLWLGAGEGRPWRYPASLALFLLSLLAKSSGVMLPCWLLLLAWWRRGRLEGRDLLRTAPFFAVSLVLGLVTLHFQHTAAIGPWRIDAGGPLARLEHAATAAGFYAVKALVPLGLEPLYADWPAASRHAAYLAPFGLLLAAAAWAWRRRRGWGRHVLLGLGWFLLHLVPVCGLAAMSYLRYSRVADHFAYLSLAAVAGLAAAGLALLARRSRPAFAVGAAAALAAGFAVQSRAHARIFHDSLTLWSSAVADDPMSWTAQYNLGRALVQARRIEEGARHYQAAIRINPGLAEAHNNLGYTRVLQGRLPEASAELHRAVQLDPTDAEARSNLGNLLQREGDLAGALAQHEEAVRLRPTFADGHINLANALDQAGRLPEALEQYRLGVALGPDSAEGHYDYGLALFQANRTEEAAEQLGLAARCAPRSALFWTQWGVFLARAGRLAEAEARLARAVELDPGFAEAQANLGQVLLSEHKAAEALGHLEAALRLDPSLNGLVATIERARQLSGAR
ncbi:MAG TPA: tetratricopeptide repeat protein [Opitutaceae bacterium]|nr:tetratricopeptide repeat protein [Opitutaceae bacterium]